MSPSSSKHFILLTASIFALGFCESRAVTADNGLVAVSSDSPSVRGILAVGDDFAVFRDTASAQAPASITVIGIGDMKVETPKVVPLSGKKPIQIRAKDVRTWEDPWIGKAVPIHIDIEQDTVYVPYGDSATTLNLTDDSTWWRWDVIWSSEPAGISGRGPSITIPDNLRQGHYTVTAAFSENPDWKDTCNVEVVRVELAQKSASGCRVCLHFTFSFVNSHIPGGVEWTISPVENCTPPTISNDGQVSIADETSGEFIITASSKNIPECSDTAEIVVYNVSYSEVDPDDQLSGYKDLYFPLRGYGASSRGIRIYFRFDPDSEDEENLARDHFQASQLLMGEATHADGSYLRAPQLYGNGSVGEYKFYPWQVDAIGRSPIVLLLQDETSYPLWYREDTPRIRPIFDGTVGKVFFRTGAYCAQSLPETCDETTTLPQALREESWNLYVRGSLNSSGGMDFSHSLPEEK